MNVSNKNSPTLFSDILYYTTIIYEDSAVGFRLGTVGHLAYKLNSKTVPVLSYLLLAIQIYFLFNFYLTRWNLLDFLLHLIRLPRHSHLAAIEQTIQLHDSGWWPGKNTYGLNDLYRPVVVKKCLCGRFVMLFARVVIVLCFCADNFILKACSIFIVLCLGRAYGHFLY